MSNTPQNPKNSGNGRKPRIVKIVDENSDEPSSVSPAKIPDTESKTKRSQNPRKPRAQKDLSLVTMQNDESRDPLIDGLDVAPLKTSKSGISWIGVFIASFLGMLSLAGGLAIDQLIAELFERQTWLGWIAAGLAGLLVVAAFAITMREIWGVSRLNTLANIRARASIIQSGENLADGFKITDELTALYFDRADMAAPKAKFELDRTDILDGDDLLALFETQIMGTIDERAIKLIMQSAKRVSVVTAISPRAMVDIAYVLLENTRLIRQISYLYGGRPGAFGFWKLTRNVLGHLAVTGAIAAGDSLIQQFVGHGVAARLSTKLGEGVVNGLLTARIGIAAMDQARPLEFKTVPRPSISEFFSRLASPFSKSEDPVAKFNAGSH